MIKMNKTIITMAVTAALTAGTMAAQAADDGPKVYGRVHLTYGAISDKIKTAGGPDTVVTDNYQLRSVASRLGVKGSMPVSDSLKAIYQLEYGVNPDSDGTSGDGLSRRNQVVGLSGGFGTAVFGRHDTPTKMYQGKFDEFNDTDADISGAMKISRGENRIDNVLAYLSPNFSGFDFAVAMAPGEGNGTTGGGGDGPANTFSVAGKYATGGLFVSVSHDEYDDKTFNVKNLTRLIGTFGNKKFQVGALYETSKKNDAVGLTGTDKDVIGLSGHVVFAAVHKLKLQYVQGTEKTAGGDTKTGQFSVGYDYKMAKATTIYAMVTSAVKDLPGGDAGDETYSYAGVGLIQNF